MRTVFFIPPLKRPSGGLAAIQELASLLARQGFDAAVNSPRGAFPETGEFDKAVPSAMYRLKLRMRSVLSGKIASPICGMTPPFASLKIGCFVSGYAPAELGEL
jgi:hypothetical protein